MAKKTKALSGASQDAYFRRVLKAHSTLSAEDRDRLVRRLRQEIAQLRLRTPCAHGHRGAARRPIPRPIHRPPAPPFDPFSPNVIVVVRTSGREAALAALAADRKPGSSSLAGARAAAGAVRGLVVHRRRLRAAIVAAAERRIANRMAAAS